YEGIVARLERLLDGQDDGMVDEPEVPEEATGDTAMGRFVVSMECEQCRGLRLRQEALAVKLGGKHIAELGSLPLPGVRDELEKLCPPAGAKATSTKDRAIMEPLVRAVVDRLGFLIDVGLSYLTLDRPAHTLSGGEGQRIRLATQIGSALVGVLYVLDEPSVGLHASDNSRLLAALSQLVELGNSVIVVEHDRDAIAAAHHVVDMGPGAGVHGGQVVAQGTPAEIMETPDSVTGPYLSGERAIPIPARRRSPTGTGLVVSGARTNNLADIDVEVPTGLLVAVTGVSGSGKSSLIVDTLLAAARAALYHATAPVGECDGVDGLEQIDKVVSIDQAPIGRTPRSNPATYTGLFGALRELYASVPEARARGYKAGRFSFNVKGGRCEACQGDGLLRVEMHFLPDIFVTCDACGGKRYNRETLEIRYRGMSIADALALTVDEAYGQFEAIGKIRDRLDALRRVGMGYVTLGQPATTLSGGEAQRVKLARELAKRATGSTLYVLDEPTTGLHLSDIEMLMASLMALRDAGNSIVIIEHNIDVVACCDWVIDLGPGGGEHGGRLVAAGTPEEVAATRRSATGQFLKRHLAAHGPQKRRKRRAKRPSTTGARRKAAPRSKPRRRTSKG
ncbi:MAG: excinuclease ABC subunit UvrA, partial [Deltaproteobacteria bacterium]|nr:excinuclease ABC subunit UvrA [Deltaproteobacteria bacterium]MBW2532725.1 excinuclease ABC subunit UvrA [Deltaproteobacteria bacterium]